MKKISILIIGLFLISFAYAETEVVTLITEEEGAIEDAPPGLYEIGRVLNDGPDIKIVSPQLYSEQKTPLKIKILFIPIEGRGVDLSKLKVEYLKLFSINITDRVMPYTTEDGIQIEKANFPKGKHKLRVTIGDVKGGITQEIFIVKLQ